MYVRKYASFNTYHPVLLLIYAIGAPILAMFTNNPIFLAVTFVSAFLVHWFYYGINQTIKAFLWMIPISCVVAVFNMLTNHRGMIILFNIGHTPFTLESLIYGLANGTLLLTVLIWFRCFSAILSNEKFLYLFGKRLPATALLLSMILKLFPETKYKIGCIQLAQNDVGKGTKNKIKHSMRQISSLLEWSMEDGIETADSMKARGYGEKNRTSYEKYIFTYSDGVLLLVFILLIAYVSVIMLGKTEAFQFFPTISWTGMNNKKTVLGMVITATAYTIFLLTPIWMEIQIKRGGEHTWKM